MDTNEMKIFAGRVVFTSVEDAIINVLFTSQANIARTAEAGETIDH